MNQGGEIDGQMVRVKLKWSSGQAGMIVPFWMADKYIIRDFKAKYPIPTGPITVERQP